MEWIQCSLNILELYKISPPPVKLNQAQIWGHTLNVFQKVIEKNLCKYCTQIYLWVLWSHYISIMHRSVNEQGSQQELFDYKYNAIFSKELIGSNHDLVKPKY